MTDFLAHPEYYQEQLEQKITRFKEQLSTIQHINESPALTVYESPKTHYRMRAEFTVWHEGNTAHYAMHDKTTKKPIFFTEFSVAAKKINAIMPDIMDSINDNELLRRKLFQIEFLTTLTEDTLVTFIYHKALTEEWIKAITPLKETLNIHIIGRSRKQKIVLGQDHVNETLNVNGREFEYRQNEGSFTQPNAKVCEKMLSWAVDHSANSRGDLLELYCGNGNFTLPLSQNFERVIATEISKSSVYAALENSKRNHIENVTIVRMSSEDFAEAMDKVREFRRLKNIDLDSYQFSTVFVDPPRAGLDRHTIEVIKAFDTIIYISCNPTTLINNLQDLGHTHTISALAAFDQFPYTDHLETGVVLNKKNQHD